MRTMGIIVNMTKDKDLEITASIIDWIERRGGKIMLTESISSKLNKSEYSYPLEKIYEHSDFIIVLGGDGTILGVARESARYETPLLGVNLGHLGFLAEVEVKEIYKSLEIIFNDDIKTEKRYMLQASICGSNYTKEFYAINDIVITRGTLSRIITMKTYINEDYVTTFNGDGLIIATPTGSTAYSLSAGGPIISPNLSVTTLTPICPHSLYSRSIVISDEEIIKVDLTENHGDAFLTIDGQEGYKIENGEHVIIKKAAFTTNLIKIFNRSFYDVLRTKLTER
jgi:NAD+ kinase